VLVVYDPGMENVLVYRHTGNPHRCGRCAYFVGRDESLGGVVICHRPAIFSCAEGHYEEVHLVFSGGALVNRYDTLSVVSTEGDRVEGRVVGSRSVCRDRGIFVDDCGDCVDCV